MKTTSWLSKDHHEYVALDLMDGRRIELDRGDKLLLAVDSITVKQKDGFDIIYPAIQVSQIIKKWKKIE